MGVSSATSKESDYVCAFLCGLSIDAREYGNFARFINDSKGVFLQGEHANKQSYKAETGKRTKMTSKKEDLKKEVDGNSFSRKSKREKRNRISSSSSSAKSSPSQPSSKSWSRSTGELSSKRGSRYYTRNTVLINGTADIA